MARRCSYCYKSGHNRRTCPKLKDYVDRNPDSYAARRLADAKKAASTRKCSFCNTTGHNRRKCPTMQTMARKAAKLNREFRSDVLALMKEHGIAEGTLVEAGAYDVWTYTRDQNGELRAPAYNKQDTKVVGLITKVEWDKINYRNGSNQAIKIQWINGFKSNGKSDSFTQELDKDNLHRFTERFKVLGALSEDRVTASKPRRWVHCTSDEIKHFFDDGAKSYYFPELQ